MRAGVSVTVAEVGGEGPSDTAGRALAKDSLATGSLAGAMVTRAPGGDAAGLCDARTASVPTSTPPANIESPTTFTASPQPTADADATGAAEAAVVAATAVVATTVEIPSA